MTHLRPFFFPSRRCDELKHGKTLSSSTEKGTLTLPFLVVVVVESSLCSGILLPVLIGELSAPPHPKRKCSERLELSLPPLPKLCGGRCSLAGVLLLHKVGVGRERSQPASTAEKGEKNQKLLQRRTSPFSLYRSLSPPPLSFIPLTK